MSRAMGGGNGIGIGGMISWRSYGVHGGTESGPVLGAPTFPPPRPRSSILISSSSSCQKGSRWILLGILFRLLRLLLRIRSQGKHFRVKSCKGEAVVAGEVIAGSSGARCVVRRWWTLRARWSIDSMSEPMSNLPQLEWILIVVCYKLGLLRIWT
ncbi:hypothetical protein Tco_1467270 [Tanacetum coccineum]